MDLQDFLKLKSDFVRGLNDTQRKRYWKQKEE